MPDRAKPNEQKRSEEELAGPADKYNPVNMAGKKIEKSEVPSTDITPGKDDYNPVNMAGKKADTPKKADIPKAPSES